MNHAPPTVRPPTRADLERIARDHYLELDDDECDVLAEVVAELMDLYERLDELSVPPAREEAVERSPGHRPDPDGNPHNAVITVCEVSGGADGSLSGYDIGIKDSIAVAGVEMTCGSKLLEGYVPTEDATVVARLLDAGATVTAKTNMDDLAWAGSAETSAFGPITNPRDPDYLAGGSSGGSAAAVAAGLVDVALGTDQGGSVRMPASWCGIVGLKPTHGLVPYTGIVPLDPTIDHVGPMAEDVDDCARVLDAVAGADGLDPRQGSVPTQEYEAAVADAPDPAELTVGVVPQGFGREESDDATDETVQAALDALADSGMTVRETPIEMHRDGGAILTGVAIEGMAAMLRNDGVAHFTDGRYDLAFARALGRARRTNANDFPPMVKVAALLGQYLADEYQGRYYAKAQNLVPELRAAYDEALADVDALALPTTPHLPYKVREEADMRSVLDRGLSMNGNTSPFNGAGHPAISVPSGTAEGLPVGLMLVGDRFDDAGLLRVAKSVEATLAG